MPASGLRTLIMFIFRYIRRFFSALAIAFASEWRIVLKDPGVLIFFLALPLAYPIAYTLVYNPEVLEKMPIAVVDDSRSPESRDLVRKIGATQAIEIYDYFPNMQDAKKLVDANEIFGILYIDSDFAHEIGRGATGHVTFFCDMALMLRFRTFAFDLTEVQIAQIGDITSNRLDMIGAESMAGGGMPVQSESFMLGDPSQGFASFVMPGILVLILQQSMVLGAVMIMGTARQRRRRHGGEDPLMPVDGPTYAVVWGKALCYVIFYIVPALFALHYIPEIFNLPHVGSAVQYLLFIFPFLLASAFFGISFGGLARDRESAFMLVVVTSVFFLFLSGLTWPRFAMPEGWQIVGDFIPATWAVQGFIQINSNNATLADVMPNFYWLWILVAAYSVLAAVAQRWLRGRNFAKTIK